jgi:putative flippase GtrA
MSAISATIWRSRTHLAKVLRYSMVSALTTGFSMIVLGVLVGIANVPAGWANVISTSCGVVPSFELNRRFVWSKRGDRSLLSEVAPFCALTFAGLGLSTLSVHVVNSQLLADGWSRAGRTAADELANFSSFGLVWVVQYVILDKIVFRHRTTPRDAPLPALDDSLGFPDCSAFELQTADAHAG